MRIKKAYIRSFAGLKDKVFEFERGFNLIYGENEAGKSSIENFIKIWLYGIENEKGHKERKKYTPLTGEKISGELTVENEGRSYIIKRTFGSNKKYDICEVIDEVTGEEINLEYKNAPGRDLLKVNYSTFNKTLFISQLGVRVNKDKEDEIIEKITNIYNAGDENTSVKKAIDKIENRKKELSGVRKNGQLDLIKKSRESLKAELIEAYKLGEENISNEEEVIKKKELKNSIEIKLKKLEVCKNAIKKLKLQDEYNELNSYLAKKKELKEKKDVLDSELKDGDGLITVDFLDEMEADSAKYSSLLNEKKKRDNKLSKLVEILNEKKKEICDKYDIFKSMGNDVKQKLYELKINQESLEEKTNNIINIQNTLARMKMDLAKQSADIESLEFIGKHREQIEEILDSYKEGLKELKYKIENQTNYKFERSTKDSDKKIKFVYIFAIMTVLIFIFSIVNRLTSVMIICLLISMLLMKLYFTYSVAIKNNELVRKNNEVIQKLKDRVEDDEEEIELYMKEINSESYEEFILMISKYDKYKTHKEHIEYVMKEREAEIKAYDIADVKEVYNDNKKLIAAFYEALSCSDMDEVLRAADDYEKIRLEMLKYEHNIKSSEDEINNIEIQLQTVEEQLNDKILKIGLDVINSKAIHAKTKEYKKKIEIRNQIITTLNNVEETYKLLLKDRNLQEIKDKMKAIKNEDFDESYQSEEEIDEEIKNKTSDLLKVEKEIKDLEHIIDKRYIGKREVSDIEEEILLNNENLFKAQQEYNALNLAGNTLREAFEEVKQTIGPDINNKVVEKFNKLTSGKYEEVKISEDYNLKIREGGILFDGEILSNGARDQLYLALRLSFISMIFKNKNIPLLLDDAFTQYDDERRKKALNLLINEDFEQILFFSCQNIDKSILDNQKNKYNYISISNIDIFNY